VSIPDRWEGASPKVIENLASRYAKQQIVVDRQPVAVRPAGMGNFSTLDVVRWFNAHGLYKRDLGGGKHAVRCPWGEEHTLADTGQSTSTVVWIGARPRLWPSFKCQHAHCDGRGILDVMRLWGDADRYCSAVWGTSTVGVAA
jgi:hypothetical protein